MMCCCIFFKKPNRITQFCMGFTGLSHCKGICFPVRKYKETYCTQLTQIIADLSISHFIEVTAIVFKLNDSECTHGLCTSNQMEQ